LAGSLNKDSQNRNAFCNFARPASAQRAADPFSRAEVSAFGGNQL
jgi:hypothetical protein